MKTKRAGRPIQPVTPGAIGDAEAAWGGFARELVKQTLDEQGLGYRELSGKLAVMGLAMTPEAVNRRINRGNFTGGFLLMCLQALDVSLIEFKDERLASVSVGPQTPKENFVKAAIAGRSPIEEIFYGKKTGG